MCKPLEKHRVVDHASLVCLIRNKYNVKQIDKYINPTTCNLVIITTFSIVIKLDGTGGYIYIQCLHILAKI